MAHNELEAFEQIELFLAGQLEGQALANFEARVKSDASFANEVALHKNLNGLGRNHTPASNHLRTALNIIREKKTKQASSRRVMFRALAVAASIALALVFLWMISKPQTKWNDDLYAEYGQHEPLSLTTKSTQVDQPQAYALQQTFNTKKYQDFLDISNPYLSSHSDAYSVLLAKAISQIETAQFEAALETLTILENSQARINKSKWYQALLSLKKGNIEKCQLLLIEIVSQNGFNAKKAEELLRRLTAERR